MPTVANHILITWECRNLESWCKFVCTAFALASAWLTTNWAN